MFRSPSTLALRVAAVLLAAPALAPIGLAQIERLTLGEMVARTDGAVLAEITARRVFRVDDPVAGPELYFTTLTLHGKSLGDGEPITVDVTFPGGFVDDESGVHNSEAPAADDVRTGNVVVAFYKWSDDMGGGVSGDALYCSHGGLYRTVAGPNGAVVLGRGPGYAVEANVAVDRLAASIRSIVAGKDR